MSPVNIPYGNGFLEYNGRCDELLISAVDKLRAIGSGAGTRQQPGYRRYGAPGD